MSQTKAQLVSGTSTQDLTVDNINTTSINSGQASGNKNLIINGAMRVAQRGTSASVTGGYLTVDRFETATGGVNEAPTQAQADVTSGGAYDAGFRKCLKVTNGNQTSTDAGDNIIALRYKVEAQDMAQSGWGYTSSSNYVTLSFWIKSSIAQSFQGVLVTSDGTSLIYPFETGSLTQNTWTKITKTIPGNASITFNNDNGEGLRLEIVGYSGSSFANNSATINAWQGYASGIQFGRASTATWYEADDATLEITGVQLEVGSTATDFEHRSYGQDLALCQRYFYMHANGQFPLSNTDRCPIGLGYGYTGTSGFVMITFPTQMRTNPSLYKVVGTDYFNFAYNNNNGYPNDIQANRMSSQVCELNFHTGSSWDQNAAGMFRTYNTAARVGFNAEL